MRGVLVPEELILSANFTPAELGVLVVLMWAKGWVQREDLDKAFREPVGEALNSLIERGIVDAKDGKVRYGKEPRKTSETYSIATKVLEYLNAKTGHRYRPVAGTLKPIIGRLKEGYTQRDLFLVVDHRTALWQHDPKMAQYLRPMTLFSQTKFPVYLAQAEAWDAAGRPEEANGKESYFKAEENVALELQEELRALRRRWRELTMAIDIAKQENAPQDRIDALMRERQEVVRRGELIRQKLADLRR